MKEFLKQTAGNPVAPFILILTLIILFSIIVSNLGEIRKAKTKEKENAPQVFQTSILPTAQKVVPAREENSFSSEKRIRELCDESVFDEDRGNYDAAEDKLKTILVFQPGNQFALTKLGLLRMKKNDFRGAAEIFREQLLYSPYNLSASIHLSMAQQMNGDVRGAIATIRKALTGSPNSPSLQIALARLSMISGEEETAEQILLRLCTVQPGIMEQIETIPEFTEFRKKDEYIALRRKNQTGKKRK